MHSTTKPLYIIGEVLANRHPSLAGVAAELSILAHDYEVRIERLGLEIEITDDPAHLSRILENWTSLPFGKRRQRLRIPVLDGLRSNLKAILKELQTKENSTPESLSDLD